MTMKQFVVTYLIGYLLGHIHGSGYFIVFKPNAFRALWNWVKGD